MTDTFPKAMKNYQALCTEADQSRRVLALQAAERYALNFLQSASDFYGERTDIPDFDVDADVLFKPVEDQLQALVGYIPNKEHLSRLRSEFFHENRIKGGFNTCSIWHVAHIIEHILISRAEDKLN